ncbi:MAG: rhodanese-like domain-containing protein [Ferruginibacter sp.]
MQQINSTTLKDKLDNKIDIILVDVREPEERAVFNIGGEFIPLGNVLSLQVDALEDYKDKEIVCYCRSGMRSLQACMMLETMGYTNVNNLEGGMLAWQEINGVAYSK